MHTFTLHWISLKFTHVAFRRLCLFLILAWNLKSTRGVWPKNYDQTIDFGISLAYLTLIVPTRLNLETSFSACVCKITRCITSFELSAKSETSLILILKFRSLEFRYFAVNDWLCILAYNYLRDYKDLHSVNKSPAIISCRPHQ